MDWTLAALGLGFGTVLGWIIGRVFSVKVAPPPAPPARPQLPVSSDPPELALVGRANGAMGIWLRRSDRGGTVELVDPAVSDPVRRVITSRLGGLATPGGRSDVERLEEGSLVFAAADDLQVAMLIPLRQPTTQPLRDLEQILGMMRTRAMLELASSKSATAQETLNSIAIRLALELERMLDAEVAVAIRRPRGAQVVGISIRADPHLARLIAIPGSAVDLVARGEVEGMVMAYDPLGVLTPDRRLRERRAFVLPISAQNDETLGAVVVWPPSGGEPAGPTRAELEAAVRRAAPRFEDAVNRLELAEQAIRDPLTRLRNRRGLEEAMGTIGVETGAVVLVDLDRFKSLNDTLGHLAGDAALELVAGVIEDAVREGDTAARIGGEEFALWLPGASLKEGLAVAERVRSQIEALEWEWQGRPWPLAASLGVAAWPETTRSRDNLVSQADAALYQAKTGGRNRVEKASLARP
ncbi:MAG: putative signaling domain protein [Gemmatimonadetes bacterium]|nr:putative signaling domain protein [Gemmatimonadota bacterium]